MILYVLIWVPYCLLFMQTGIIKTGTQWPLLAIPEWFFSSERQCLRRVSGTFPVCLVIEGVN